MSILADRLTKIDDLTRPDHYYLKPSDRCYYVGDYSPRKGFGFRRTNYVVHNFKKPADRKGQPEWRYKGQAINQIADTLRLLLKDEWLELATVVPMPPSKAKDDPLYDDRMLLMVARMCRELDVDIRELIIQDTSLSASHSSNQRLSPDDLIEHYQLDENLIQPTPNVMGVFDDILTTGAHYRAVKDLLNTRFPEVEVIGFFFARVVRPEPDFEEIFGF